MKPRHHKPLFFRCPKFSSEIYVRCFFAASFRRFIRQPEFPTSNEEAKTKHRGVETNSRSQHQQTAIKPFFAARRKSSEALRCQLRHCATRVAKVFAASQGDEHKPTKGASEVAKSATGDRKSFPTHFVALRAAADNYLLGTMGETTGTNPKAISLNANSFSPRLRQARISPASATLRDLKIGKRAYTFPVAAVGISIRPAPHIEAPVKNISVKEAAEALGVTPRTIQYKLQNGDLKGTRSRNQFGKDEWRIYPNKLIADAIAQKSGTSTEMTDFAPLQDDIVDAEDVTGEEFNEPAPDWRQMEMQRLEMMAEKFVKPLADRIESQAIFIREQEQIIAEQKRSLLLLPDLKKKAEEEAERAEAERKTAELNKLESVALQTQIQALKEEQKQSEEAKDKVTELERALEESKAEAQLEIERVRQEKDAQAAAVQQQLEAMNATIQELKRPWWKKMFVSPPDA
jgi:excisionase family DNA binding protein